MKNVGFLTRLKSTIIDLFIIYMPLLYIITYIFMGNKEDFLSSNLAPFFAVSGYALIYTILLGKNAQTPGKKAYEIMVVNKDNSKISYLKSFLRFYLFLFSCTSIVGILIIFFRKDKKTLHDLILQTKVIYKK